MLAAIFVKNGADSVTMPEQVAEPAKRVTDRVGPVLTNINEKAPTEAKTLVQINGGIQAASGLLLLTRFRRPAALALAGTLIPTTAAGHAFWAQDKSEDRAKQFTQFLKNMGLFGGLVLAALDNGGKPGLRWRAGHMAHVANKSVRRTNKSMRRTARHQGEKVNVAVKAATAAGKTSHKTGSGMGRLASMGSNARSNARQAWFKVS